MTASLVVGAALLAVGLGVWLALDVRSPPGRWQDRAITAAATALYSVPSIVLAALLWAFVAHKWGWFPDGGYMALRDNPFEWARHLILPWLAAGLPFAGAYVQIVRASLLRAVDEEWVRTARAKGLLREAGDPPARAPQRPDPAGEHLGARLLARVRRLRAVRRGDLRAAGRRVRSRPTRSAPSTSRRSSRSRSTSPSWWCSPAPSWTSRSPGSIRGSGGRGHRPEPTPALLPSTLSAR